MNANSERNTATVPVWPATGLAARPGVAERRLGPGDPILLPTVIDGGVLRAFGASAAFHLVFLLVVFFVPPEPEGISFDLTDQTSRFAKIVLTAPEVRREAIPEWLARHDEKKASAAPAGARHAGAEGMAGDRRSAKNDNAMGIKGPANNPRPTLGREAVKEYAASAGVLALLSNASAVTSPFATGETRGADPENALGHLIGNQIGVNWGFNGLGVHNTGRGGGGNGSDTIGVGVLDTIGFGPGGRGPRGRYGESVRDLGPHRVQGPRPRPGTPYVLGSLSREVIQREVRRHLNEVAHCYEQGLARRPDLAGRVAVLFQIGANGLVNNTAIADSSLGDLEVERCISQAVRRWSFPRPEGGVVMVTYPFQLASSGR